MRNIKRTAPDSIIDEIENNVLDNKKYFILAQNSLNIFNKKYEIYENLDNMNLFDVDTQHWFYHNHIYYNVLKQISKVYIHSKYLQLLKRFIFLNYKESIRFETEQIAIKNCKRLQLAPTDIQIEVSILCEILRAFDYSFFDCPIRGSVWNNFGVVPTLSLRNESVGTKNPKNFIKHLPEFQFLNKPEIYKVVAKGVFIGHSYFSKIIKNNMKIS